MVDDTSYILVRENVDQWPLQEPIDWMYLAYSFGLLFQAKNVSEKISPTHGQTYVQ